MHGILKNTNLGLLEEIILFSMNYHILEVANTHGGNIESIVALIYEFSHYRGDALKLQPLPPACRLPVIMDSAVYIKNYISLSMYHSLTYEEFNFVIERINDFYYV